MQIKYSSLGSSAWACCAKPIQLECVKLGIHQRKTLPCVSPKQHGKMSSFRSTGTLIPVQKSPLLRLRYPPPIVFVMIRFKKVRRASYVGLYEPVYLLLSANKQLHRWLGITQKWKPLQCQRKSRKHKYNAISLNGIPQREPQLYHYSPFPQWPRSGHRPWSFRACELHGFRLDNP